MLDHEHDEATDHGPMRLIRMILFQFSTSDSNSIPNHSTSSITLFAHWMTAGTELPF